MPRTIYTNRGPVTALGNQLPHDRPMTTQLRMRGAPAEPQNLQEHIEAALSRVPGLGPKQRAAVVNVMLEKLRDITFLRMLTDAAKAKGPWSEHAMDEGRPL